MALSYKCTKCGRVLGNEATVFPRGKASLVYPGKWPNVVHQVDGKDCGPVVEVPDA